MTKSATQQVETMTAEAQKTMEAGVEKMTKGFETAAAFNQENVEAIVESSKIAAKIVESMGAEIAAYSKKSYEDGLAMTKELTACKSVSEFVEERPTLKVLALSFLLLIGMALFADGLHHHIPKGYIYFAMGFSVFVEALNLRLRKKGAAPVRLHAPYVEHRL